MNFAEFQAGTAEASAMIPTPDRLQRGTFRAGFRLEPVLGGTLRNRPFVCPGFCCAPETGGIAISLLMVA